MHVGKTLFSQIMDFVPWTSFARIVQRYSGNTGVRTLSCAEQFRATAFAQLTWRESLRDIEASMSASATKLYAMGFRSAVKRSSLADANETRDWRIWADLAAIAWFCASRLRRLLADRVIAERSESYWMLIMVLAILFGSLLSEVIGFHALFGAFVVGIAVSSNPQLRRLVEERIEPFAAVLLLPLFFASTGLRTRIDLLSGQEWMLCLAITLVATLGKLGGTVLAARLSGMERADSWRLGALMNTRGLMELIVLGVGYDLGLINRSLYAILVLVAITATVMTGPLLGFIDRRAGPPADR